MFRIGSFNVGIHQDMLTGTHKRKSMRKVERVITICVTDVGLHIMNLCGLGGHRQGLSAANISALDMKIFQGTEEYQGSPSVSINSNYLTSWGFDADTTQFGIKATRPSKTYWLSSDICEPELVVHSFENGVGVILILGNLHVRTPHEVNVSTKLKQRILTEALETLESEVPFDSTTQPVVLVLVGDCNLSIEPAEDATLPLQPHETGNESNWRTVWQVHTTTAALSGDLIFVKGANAMSFDLPFGSSERKAMELAFGRTMHRDRGVWNDCHDAIGIELRVKAEAEPEPASKRNRMCSDQSDDDACQPGDAPQLFLLPYPRNGGSVRTVLDNVVPTSSDDESQSLDEEEPNQTYLPELDSSSNSSSNS